jgi:hypothetical protein
MIDPRYGDPIRATGPPRSVVLAKIILMVRGVLSLVVSVLVLALRDLAGPGYVVVAVTAAFAVVEIAVAVALGRLRPGARRAAFVVAGLDLVLSLLSLPVNPLGSVLGAGFCGYVIYLLFRPETLAAFGVTRR